MIDSRPREETLGKADANFLGVMAENVMQYLDMQQESEARMRTAIMSRGLAAFTEGKQHISSEVHRQFGNYDTTENSHSEYGPREMEGSAPSLNEDDYFVRRKDGPQTHDAILTIASDLLREALDVDITLFLDSKHNSLNNNRMLLHALL